MGELHAFFDKDVFIKLACCDLWGEVLEALGVTHPYRLASASASGSKTALRRMDIDDGLRAAATGRLKAMADQVPVVPEGWVAAAVTTPLYNRMSFTEGIDTGEAQIALVALHCESAVIFDNGGAFGIERAPVIAIPMHGARIKSRCPRCSGCSNARKMAVLCGTPWPMGGTPCTVAGVPLSGTREMAVFCGSPVDGTPATPWNTCFASLVKPGHHSPSRRLARYAKRIPKRHPATLGAGEGKRTLGGNWPKAATLLPLRTPDLPKNGVLA